jgi:FHA domain-containing protein/double zinc ribbon protein
MSAVCPQGHNSSTGDFCDVCGAPIEPGASASAGTSKPPVTPTPLAAPPTPAPPAPPASPSSLSLPPAAAAPNQCPNCGAANSPDALFCEDCGYDFATGQLPPPPATIDPGSGRIRPAASAPADLSQVDWVAEIWIDPDWFTHQQAEGACPTSGMPTVVPLKGTVALIGRRSKSRNISPEIDCSNDGAISHRHAELSRNGERWSVKDLGSTNGTYVGEPGRAHPDDALEPQRPRELADDERIYLGAWTRVVVRKATDAEKASAAS